MSEDPAAFETRLSHLRHELRTPIGHIIGYAELIAEDLDEAGRHLYGADLAAIIGAGQRMLGLIDQHLGGNHHGPDEVDLPEAQFGLRLHLNHIGGYAEILREEAVEAGAAGLVGDLDHISEGKRRLVELIEEMPARLAGTAATAPTLPADEGASAEEPATLAGVGGDILVVDDDQANRELLTRRLARGGYRSLAVASGEAALGLLAAQRFDLVLLDMRMEGLSGLETLAAMKENPRLRGIPVIMLSAGDDSALMVRSILAGAEDYVAKPFNPVLLIARINACLEKIRLRQNAARQVRVFISSPGDVIAERQVAKMVLGRLNEEFAGRLLLVPILWEEEPLLASDTFQAQIHPPRDTDIYLGIFWSRIGSPLPATILRADGTTYESGSVFEFEDALAGFRQSGRPEMLLYRKEGWPEVSLGDRAAVLDGLDQLERLHAYLRANLSAADGSFVAAYHQFATAAQFETMIETHLRKLVQKFLPPA